MKLFSKKEALMKIFQLKNYCFLLLATSIFLATTTKNLVPSKKEKKCDCEHLSASEQEAFMVFYQNNMCIYKATIKNMAKVKKTWEALSPDSKKKLARCKLCVNSLGEKTRFLSFFNPTPDGIEIARLLIEGGLSANTLLDKTKQTLLHRVADIPNFLREEISLEILESFILFLLTHNASINAQDFHGQTPLHLAAKRGNNDIMAILRENGADTHIKDEYGKLPRDYYKQTNNKE